MTTTTDEAADESRVATWLGLRFFGREKAVRFVTEGRDEGR